VSHLQPRLPLFNSKQEIGKIAKPVQGLHVLFALALTAPVAAQETGAVSTPAASDPIEAITVTGSRLARTGYETPTPVTVIGDADIRSSGQPNIADFVNELPSVSGSTAPST